MPKLTLLTMRVFEGTGSHRDKGRVTSSKFIATHQNLVLECNNFAGVSLLDCNNFAGVSLF